MQANDLVKIQVCASFHMRAHQLADTRWEVILKLIELCVDTLSCWCQLSKKHQYSRGGLNKDFYGEVTDESIMASNKRNTTWTEGDQLLCKVAL